MSDKTETELKNETAPQDPTAPKNEAPDLTVQDLQTIKGIIDVASSRGAFRPNEMTAVGTVYTKLETFLKAVASQQTN